jgi:hypothetical protein
MTFNMTVDLDNAAFDDDYDGPAELARILDRTAGLIRGFRSLGEDRLKGPGVVRDINGNTVGTWEVLH